MNRVTAFLVGAVLGAFLGGIVAFVLSFFVGGWAGLIGRRTAPLMVQLPLYVIGISALIGGTMSYRHHEDRGFNPGWRGAAWGATIGLALGVLAFIPMYMAASASPMSLGAMERFRGTVLLLGCLPYLLGPALLGTALGALIGALVGIRPETAAETPRHTAADESLDDLRTTIEERIAPFVLERTGPVDWEPAHHPSARVTELTGRYELSGAGVRASILRSSSAPADVALHVLFQIHLPAPIPERGLQPDRLVLAGVNRTLAEHLICDSVSPTGAAASFGLLSSHAWTDPDTGTTYEMELNAHDRIGGADVNQRFLALSADLSHVAVPAA